MHKTTEGEHYSMDRILGVVPPVLTPFDQNGQLIEGEFREYLSFLLDKGVDGVFVLGTTGEGTLLSTREREEVEHKKFWPPSPSAFNLNT